VTTYEILSLICGVFIAAFGGVYFAVRLALRAEINGLELRVAERYVDKDTCRAIRDDCSLIRAAVNHKPGGHPPCDATM
jgi:hypothetical protein